MAAASLALSQVALPPPAPTKNQSNLYQPQRVSARVPNASMPAGQSLTAAVSTQKPQSSVTAIDAAAQAAFRMQLEAQFQGEAATQVEADAQAQAEAQAVAEIQAQARAQADLQAQADAKAQAEAQALAEAKAQAQSQSVQAPAKKSKGPEPRRVRFNVGANYHVMDVIGEGAYGVVCSAIHRPSQQKVAIKKITPFDHSMFCLRTLRELKLLKYFQEQNVSENIISILDIIKAPTIELFKEVYIIQELMETDMHRVIRTQDLSEDHCQYFIYQTLRAMKALHSADIIHRDLKPSNLLLNANCDLKVCDFGLARSVRTAEEQTGFMTEYVATRWYRAPEIMLTFKQYTKAIDIWSIGCILAEMLSGRPLFPGRDYHHQLTLILDVLGTPSLDEFYAINSRRSRDYIRALPFRKKRNFASLYPNASELAIDFLNKTLTFDPNKRATVEEALAHPYLNDYHDPKDEPTAPPLEEDFFAFDRMKDEISRETLKELLYQEVVSFKPLV